MLSANILALIIGFFADMVLGDPRWAYHPVRLIGNAVSLLERYIYRRGNFIEGVLLLLSALLIVGGAYIAILVALWHISYPAYIAASAFGVWVGISVKDMKDEVRPVISALEANDLPEARKKISLLVSRDTKDMKSEKIASSAIETVGENFTDAVISPIFYATLFGGAGAIIFKVVSTLDSMVGYRNSRYERFGTASARMDDLLGFIPARLSIIPIMFGAILAGESPMGAWFCYWDHRKDHASPNSAHSISAFAGALKVRLGGATSYGGVVYDKAVIIGGERPLTAARVSHALTLYDDSAFFAVAIAILFLYIMQ
ncbi:MAG: adenosylcobinamide-phosphate synthase CbiB [Deferribacteraceae bacterium]|jgi:adenosylcobinamide-phosphate synthase|nr:adenosylcobinamide-phosphate synthase CbiB [Deferribacteraceae bacterium]